MASNTDAKITEVDMIEDNVYRRTRRQKLFKYFCPTNVSSRVIGLKLLTT
jgi:hypothetical protein